MYHIFWISIVLLVVACGEKNREANARALKSVGIYLSQVETLGENVSLYGYLVKKNGVLFLYHDEKLYRFASSESESLRIRVYLPDNKIDPKCFGVYTSLYGVSHNYLGEIAVDDISRVTSLIDDHLCYVEPKPMNYFSFLRNK